jgi:hypothetical protein
MTEEEARIRGYLEAQGAKLSPAAIIEKVRAAMAELRAAAASVPPARFHDRPEPEEWSGNEVMAHVVETGNYFGGQIMRALDGLSPVDSGRDRSEKRAPRHTAPEWCTILERDREALFERVVRADPTSRLDKRIEHGMFGTLNWRETLLFLRLHDLDHARQLEKNAAALA